MQSWDPVRRELFREMLDGKTEEEVEPLTEDSPHDT
jgi:hypothetical protein